MVGKMGGFGLFGVVFKGRLNNDRESISALAAIKTLISSPTCPLSRFLESLKSDLRCPIIGSIAARLLHSLRFLSR
jgi:hypothetical protein